MAISQKLNILIVDDVRAQITTLKDILAKTGFKNISYAVSCKEATEKVQEFTNEQKPVELILCSNDIKESSGVAIHKAIKNVCGSSKFHFLLISGRSDQEHIIEAAKNGIKHILLRPFSPQALINELAKMLN